MQNSKIAEQLSCERHAVGKWRRRWQKGFEELISIECAETTKALRKAITDLLSDQHRRGCRPKFLPDQVAHASSHPLDFKGDR
ncbi:MAG: hypothetical protein AAF483_07720 [Planctomycetota bacterium]